MGIKALIVIAILWAFSFLVMSPDLGLLPYWISSNTNLNIITMVGWNIGFAILFIKFGLGI